MGNAIENKFEKMGARVRVTIDRLTPTRIDIRRDRDGEYFDVRHNREVDVQVVDVRPAERHLLLMMRRLRPRRDEPANSKFLCGHDERAWFVAAVPEDSGATSVQDAKDALKPKEVWESMREWAVPMELRNLRRTNGFLRQGEWFFLPRPWLEVYEQFILHNEPIQRGGGRPHVCQHLYRTDGVAVRVCDAYPNGLTEDEFCQLGRDERLRHAWRDMRRGADVFVNGYVQHPDHETLVLPYWHRVVMNTETKARAMEDLAFLD